LVKYLVTFEGEDEQTLAAIKEDVSHAAIQAIRLPEIHECENLLSLAAIKQLKNDSTYSKLYELLHLFTAERLDAYLAFKQKFPEYVDSIGLSNADCEKKIRLLTLATLATGTHSDVPYATIADALKIPEADVEQWIVNAISSSMVDAKIDQLKRTVQITCAIQRVFGPEQWKQLSERLQSSRNQVKSLLDVVENQSKTVA